MFHLHVTTENKKSIKYNVNNKNNNKKINYDEEIKNDLNINETISFTIGNPRVELISGRLRLYRQNNLKINSSFLSKMNDLPDKRGLILCIIAIPSHMSPMDILEFTLIYRNYIESIRILRDSKLNRYMSLIHFKKQKETDQFFQERNNTLFNSIENERCRLVYVEKVEIYDTSTSNHSTQRNNSNEKENKRLLMLSKNLVNCQIDNKKGKKKTRKKRNINELKLLDVMDRPCVENIGCSHIESFDKKKYYQTNTKAVLLETANPPPPSGMTEIPTCAVCLERLDISASGIMTTLCNHSFHCDCLFRWEGISCPVCRYGHEDLNTVCQVCGTTEHLWICLICGNIGCGRYSGEHANQHYQESYHTYSLELETQRVWDYAGDGYVHRLILNKEDGKFVEFPHPRLSSDKRSQLPPRTDAEYERQEHLKLESLATEYSFLLSSQLEKQRIYYEKLVENAKKAKVNTDIVASLEQEKKQLKRENSNLVIKLKTSEKDLSFVKELNQSLIENQIHWKEKIQQADLLVEKIKKDAYVRITELESQVRDLMFYLDTQKKVEQSPNKEELQNGLLQVERSLTSPNEEVKEETISASGIKRITNKKKTRK